MIRPIRLALAGAVALSGLGAPAAGATEFKVTTPSTSTDGVTDFAPRIAGAIVVWQHDTGSASEIRIWDGTESVFLTQNGFADQNPDSDGTRVVWQQASGAQNEIVVYNVDLQTTSFPFIHAADDTEPLVSSTHIAWLRRPTGADAEVFLSPNNPEQITGNSVEESDLALAGGSLVWVQVDDNGTPANPDDDDSEIWVWTSPGPATLYQLSSNGVDDIRPAISGSRIVWQSGEDESGDVWLGDTSGNAMRLLDGTDDRHPDIDGDVVVWQHSEITDFEIFKRDLNSTEILQITTNGFHDVTPRISGDDIVWVVEPAVGDSEIWVSWNGGAREPIDVTQGDGRDDVNPQIDNELLAWESCTDLGGPSQHCEIRVAPEAGGRVAAGAVLAMLALHAGVRSRGQRP